MTQEFEQAVTQAKTLTKRPSNEDLLKLYSLYKQATEGDISGERPVGFDFKGAAKYDAWQNLKGMPATEAEQAYIKLVKQLQASE